MCSSFSFDLGSAEEESAAIRMRFPTKVPVSFDCFKIKFDNSLASNFSRLKSTNYLLNSNFIPFSRSSLSATAKKPNCHTWKSVNFWYHKNLPCHNSFRLFVIAWKLDPLRRYSFWSTIVRWCRWANRWLKSMLKIVAKTVFSTYIMHHKKFSANELITQQRT